MPQQWQQLNSIALVVTLGVIATFVQVYYHQVPQLSRSYLKKGWIAKCQNILLEWQTWIQKVWNAPEPSEDSFKTFETLKEFATTQEGHYGTSQEPRWVRPDKVQFKVGEVVSWKEGKATGVIVGWDEQAKMPPGEKPDDIQPDTPYYLIAMDSREAKVTYDQLRYLPQSDIELVTPPRRILSLVTSKYFETFQSGKYVMRPWLEQIYPKDVN